MVAGLPLERIMLETDCPWCVEEDCGGHCMGWKQVG